MPPRMILIIDPALGYQVRNRIVIERTTWSRIHLAKLLQSDAGEIGRVERINGDTIPAVALAGEGVKEGAAWDGRVARHHDVHFTSSHRARDRIPYTGGNSRRFVGDDEHLLAVVAL